MKTIIFVPPNGILKRQDFSIARIVKILQKDKGIKSILLYINSAQDNHSLNYFDQVYQVKSEEELFNKLSSINYDSIFSRSWMHAYSFSAKLVKKFDNVIVNIKDWNFSTREEYKFLFGNDDDFDAIKYIFENAKYILSHYTDKQAKLWAKKYQVSKEKFIFFPEYCVDINQSVPKTRKVDSIVFAGTFGPTVYPEQFYVSKDMYKTIHLITKKELYLDYILPPKFYDNVDSFAYQDFLFENYFNKFFNIKRGKELDNSIILEYGYGIFTPIINDRRSSDIFKYAIPSKFSFYLEANLPMIVNKKMKSLSKIVLENGLGIVVSNKDMLNIKSIIKDQDYDGLLQNIIKYKEKFQYNNDKINLLI